MQNDLTRMRIELDDETMEAVIEQAVAARAEPRAVIAAVVRDVFLAMKAEGRLMRLLPAQAPPSESKH